MLDEDHDHEYVIISLHQVLQFMSKATDILKQQDEIAKLTNSEHPPIDPHGAYFKVSCSERMLQELLFKVSFADYDEEE